MAESTKILWTHSTFNPWRGCTKVSPGCANCYAEAQASRFPDVLGVWGRGGTRVAAAESTWAEPLRWDRLAAKAGERRRVFCASLADVFEAWRRPLTDSAGEDLRVPRAAAGPFLRAIDAARTAEPVTMDRARLRLFDLIRATPNLDWLLLTKRPENVRPTLGGVAALAGAAGLSDLAAWLALWAAGTPPANVWLGTSVEDQVRADERIPHLAAAPAALRFLSAEPLLGPVAPDLSRVDWVIVGGESGPRARPCHADDVRDLVARCRNHGVACFVKQLGANAVGCGADQHSLIRMADAKGGDVDEFPPDLRVRQFPRVA